MLIGVFFLDKSHATHRWFRLGPASLQPSELAKLAVILYLAWFLEMRCRPRSFGVNDLRHTLAPAAGVRAAAVGPGAARAGPGHRRSKFSSSRSACCLWPGFRKSTSSPPARRPCRPSTWPSCTSPIATTRVMAFLHPGRRPARPRLPAGAVADRGGLGRLLRRGPDGEQAEALLSARGAHRFHLRGAVRGTGLYRRRHCAGAVCRLRLARAARGVSRPG